MIAHPTIATSGLYALSASELAAICAAGIAEAQQRLEAAREMNRRMSEVAAERRIAILRRRQAEARCA